MRQIISETNLGESKISGVSIMYQREKQGNKPVSKAIPTLEVLEASVMLAGPLPENAPVVTHKTGKEESQEAAPKDSVKKRASS